MSLLFMPALVLHVAVAVLGLGTILALGLVASAAGKVGRGGEQAALLLAPLLRSSALSLGAMFVTGILIDVAAGGSFHDWWWFRGSAVLLVLTGVLHGLTRRIARRGLGSDAGREATLRGIARLAYVMSMLLAVIVVLMEVKPF